MTDSENPKKKITKTSIIITLLVIVALLQAAILVNQSLRQAVRGKQNFGQATALPEQPSALWSRPRAAAPAPKLAPVTPQAPYDQDPFEEFDAMSRRMSNMMRNAFMYGAPMLQNLRQGMNQAFSSDFSPAIDLEETKDSYIVRGDLPGLDKDKISITVKDNVLTIEGVRQTMAETNDQNKGFYAQERSYGSFARSLLLPGPVDENKITADYKNGVLTITLPKTEDTKNVRKVAIQ